MRFKWMWRRQKQTQNCAALPSLSTRADILKRVNHRNLRCSALRGLRCKTVSGTLRGAGKSRRRTVLPCLTSQLALTYWNVWITETCATLPCMGCVACVSMCARPYIQRSTRDKRHSLNIVCDYSQAWQLLKQLRCHRTRSGEFFWIVHTSHARRKDSSSNAKKRTH